MKKLWSKIHEIIPYIWSIAWIIVITSLSIGVMIWSISWLLRMLGVIV